MRAYVDRVLKALRKCSQVLALAGINENNTFHGGAREPNVLVHTRLVERTVQDLIGLPGDLMAPFPQDTKLTELLKQHFACPVGVTEYTWADLQKMFAILHDIGKISTIIRDASGVTKATGHETESARLLHGVFLELALDHNIALPAQVEEELTILADMRGPEVYDLILFDRGGDLNNSLEERAEWVLRCMTHREQVAIMINVLADFGAGRTEPTQGFTEEHKDKAKLLLAHFLRQEAERI